jgi:hypothetical protein
MAMMRPLTTNRNKDEQAGFRAWLDARATRAAVGSVTCVSLLALAGLLTGSTVSAGQPVKAAEKSASRPIAATDATLERGRYLVRITGCNDCHTPGYGEHGGRVPVSEWLTGTSVGFRGPWGTSYPSNLRLTMRSLSEDQWLVFARAERLPPMPWFSLEAMNDLDLRAIYRFIYSLGPQGVRAPSALLPGAESATPFIVFVAQDAKTAQR